MAPHSSTLAWKIPWMKEPGRLQSMGSLRVGHDWATSLSLYTFIHWRRKWQPTPVFSRGKSQGRGSLVGCRLWGRTESDTTEVTQQQQQQQDCSQPGSSIHGILQARILKWISMPSSRGSSQGLNPCLLRLLHCRWIPYRWATGQAPWEAGSKEKQGNKGLRKSRNELGILGHRAWTTHALLSLEFSCLSCIISGVEAIAMTTCFCLCWGLTESLELSE